MKQKSSQTNPWEVNPWDNYWRKANQRDKIAPLILPVVFVFFIFIIILSIHLSNEHAKNSAPQHGVVQLPDNVSEFCSENGVMIYKTDQGLTVDPNSYACEGAK